MEDEELVKMTSGYKPRKVQILHPEGKAKSVRRARVNAAAANQAVDDLFERALAEQDAKEAESRAKLRALAGK